MINYITLPQELINNKNNFHYKLFDFDDIHQFKLFLFILAKVTVIYKTNKKRIKGTQSFHISEIFTNNDVLLKGSMTYEKIKKFINGLDTPFFKEISYSNKEVHFKISYQYIKLLLSAESHYCFDFQQLKGVRDVRAAKLQLLLGIYKKSGFFHLNYLFKVLDLNKITRRDRKIYKIKHCFNSLGVEFDYKHPVNQYVKKNDGDYKFYYNLEPKRNDNEALDDDKLIDDIFNADDLFIDDNEVDESLISSSNLLLVNEVIYGNNRP
ncbi:hypothetical protein [Vibrio jasicida]|uniref:hypothetical protein n=1 Tax=Vibrio jasicida TaxID=766224 RepID=UPI0005EE559B|nr:hypothetical protein [Vibrio jasicida]